MVVERTLAVGADETASDAFRAGTRAGPEHDVEGTCLEAFGELLEALAADDSDGLTG